MMGRRLRFLPAGQLVEVTSRTVQGRFLLRPTAGLREIFIGILARAQERHSVRIHFFVCLSNHYHLLITPETAADLAGFMRYLNTNLSKEAGRLHRWRGSLFERRYQAILVSEEEAAQVARLRYLLSHGCKEGLVAVPSDWPGAHAVQAFASGLPCQGIWYNRTREWPARLTGKRFQPEEFATAHALTLEPLPCWQHLRPAQRQERAQEMIADIEGETARRHQAAGTRPAGVTVVLRQDPHERPQKTKWSAAPLVHAATKGVRRQFYFAYALFFDAFRDAAEKLKRGDRTFSFPSGSFPPALPFALSP